MNRIQTGRDPFARLTIRKYLVTGTCQWCGNTRHVKGQPTGKVWFYHAEADSPRNSGWYGKFCNIGCLNAYHY